MTMLDTGGNHAKSANNQNCWIDCTYLSSIKIAAIATVLYVDFS